MKTCMVIPDAHFGLRVGPASKTPIQDIKATQLAVRLARLVNPQEIILLGDMLDLAPWSSKFPSGPDLKATTQESLENLHQWLKKIREAAPKAKITYLEGNHEARVGKLLLALAPEALGLKAVGEQEAALSIPNLLALDKLGIRYVGPYPSSYWLWGQVLVQHGSIVRRGGGRSVAGLLDANPVHQIMGHVHRAELAGRTVQSPVGPRTAWAMSPGTLARLDGVVPAGSPHNDWQAGLGLVYLDRHGHVTMSLVPIQGGTCVYNGKLIAA